MTCPCGDPHCDGRGGIQGEPKKKLSRARLGSDVLLDEALEEIKKLKHKLNHRDRWIAKLCIWLRGKTEGNNA